MAHILDKRKRRFFTLIFLIHPFLFLVGIIDFILSLFLPYKYKDDALPKKTAILSKQVDETDPKSPYRSAIRPDLVRVEDKDANLFDQLTKAANQFYNRQTFGVRELLSIDDEKQPNGKVFKKYSLGEYKWSTYEELYARMTNFSNGLLKLGLKSDQNVVLFSETRPEWMIAAFSCFRIKAPVVTLYATLGIDALPFGINQTDAKYLVTSAEQLPKIRKILDKISNITNIVVFTDKLNMKSFIDFKVSTRDNPNLSVMSIDEVEDLGRESANEAIEFTKPKKDDLAVIMYTSGSTGNPKGVMISHGNLLAGMQAFKAKMGTIKDNDLYIAYLPLAHVLELSSELTCIMYGVSIGYSTPQTITDTSTAIKKGQKGDLRVLKPTIMASVPIILERLTKTVNEKLATTSWFLQTLFKRAYIQKLRRFRRGASTRLLDRLLFKRISSAVLGGRIRVILCGGAILSKEVHEFSQVCLAPTIQGYGLTETCAMATSQHPNETDNETVGSLAITCEIRLVDWPEAGYRTTDKPNPRGEVLIGGENVTMGYYKLPEKTEEDYSYINGIRYFATGDIGEMLPNGNLKIIDRKKDLVKLSGGEYVSLNKVESLIKLMPLVDNVCVVANPLKSFCVALVCPNLKQLKEIFKQQMPEVPLDTEKNTEKLLADLSARLDANQKLVAHLIKEIVDHCLAHGVDRFEIPARVKFVKEIWLPDTGLVTDSLKLKRKELEKFYSNEIQKLYE